MTGGDASVHVQKPRSLACFKPVLLEVAGSLDDSACEAITRRLRQFHNRYALIMRFMATLMVPAVEESRLFVHTDEKDNSNGVLGKETEEDDGSKIEKERSMKKVRLEPLITAPRAAVVAEKRIPIVHRLHEKNGKSALEKLEFFMAYHFLPLALLHNIQSDPSPDNVPFLLRHYIHEATRTASFLIADIKERTAVVIDPQLDISIYEADLSLFNLRLIGVILTHCFVDISVGHNALLKAYPDAVLLSGTPWTQENEDSLNEWPTLTLSPRLHLRAIPLPSFSPECMIVELHLDSVLLALFTGTVISVDALPRNDFFNDFPGFLSPNGLTTNDAAAVAQRFLKQRLWERYFEVPEEISSGRRQSLDHVILFPSHGGYNNVTHQLDLYWAAHLGDLKRMKHSRTVLDNILDVNAYIKHVNGRPSLPKPVLFSHVRKWNMLSYPSAFGGSGAKFLASQSLDPMESLTVDITTKSTTTTTTNDDDRNNNNNNNIKTSSSSGSSPIVLDIRDTLEHERLHLKGSVNVPMKFPADAYGVKKAELWLQCILLPFQSVVVICANKQELPLIQQRLALISPGAIVEAFVAKELQPSSEVVQSACSTEIHSHYCSIVTDLPLSITSRYLPRQLVWVIGTTTSALSRVDKYQDLQCIEPVEGTVVLDCRTAYEFKNGSHKYSVHIPLADLCQMTALDGLKIQSSDHNINKCEVQSVEFHGPSPQLGQAFLRQFCRPSLTAGIKRIIVYCAAGYRSLIAASLLRRAFEAAGVSIEVRDVSGGALQIMKQRPDLWEVKDRSIICIS
ncbi:beta-lactamase domain-containing protein [Trypanosoma theileri]|uniref:Beta-lactamase domain-containing protein n=1 Tax=Trypanosoma theileri TaxID=67003 RepID=A0A1X0P997_9TRYP|nr:beta-lactamase domain-containing protein [Trypanosoma theileri]ORC93504.1 beta-lactamase domain-containing protein [Trypanosoma theileri]